MGDHVADQDQVIKVEVRLKVAELEAIRLIKTNEHS
jgi:hypothetical protein